MKKKDNFMDFIPCKNMEWGKDEKGRIYLIKEKSKNRMFKKVIGWFNRSQFFHIHLDELGSEAWGLADGRQSVYEIALKLRETFGLKAEPVEQRVAQFFAILKRNGFVRFQRD